MNSKNWAEQQEAEDNLKDRNISIEQKDDIKTVTEIVTNPDGQKIKVVKRYKIEVRKVPKSVIKRKAWKKFGNVADKNTQALHDHQKLCEETKLELINSNKTEKSIQEEPVFKSYGVKCRVCQGDHFTHSCDKALIDSTGLEKRIILPVDERGNFGLNTFSQDRPDGQENENNSQSGGKYIPPNLRKNAAGQPMAMLNGGGSLDYNQQRLRDECTIKVTNLPILCDEKDLGDLFTPLGPIAKTALIKDRINKISKGIAYITYKNKESARKAISMLNSHRYYNMILNVEWAKKIT
ncbi:unnamed protein product [Gordionus sp. m RMFG-2023]|uniref:eukaryotic translation initiation factor 3 subunit G-like n=1 Tax=Gordionus sp. m RMFG-2023 TaxID=3053472 RepID=UPI0030DFE66A